MEDYHPGENVGEDQYHFAFPHHVLDLLRRLSEHFERRCHLFLFLFRAGLTAWLLLSTSNLEISLAVFNRR